jgi:hypothetical protein
MLLLKIILFWLFLINQDCCYDLIILSKSKTGLQNSLDNLSEYCDKWQLTVNVKKSKTMILQNNCGKLRKNWIAYSGI